MLCFLFLETKVGLLGFYLLKHLGFLRIREGGRLLGRLAVVGVAGQPGRDGEDDQREAQGDELVGSPVVNPIDDVAHQIGHEGISQQVDPRAAHIDKAHEGAEYRQCHFHSTVVSYSVELALLSKMILFSIFWLMVSQRLSFSRS